MKIRISTVTGYTFRFHLLCPPTVDELKYLIYLEQQIPPKQQLLFKSKDSIFFMNDRERISHDNCNTLHLRINFSRADDAGGFSSGTDRRHSI